MLHRSQPADGRAMSTFWRYARIQLMVFVLGCIGPIFLAIYFATQPDPTMKWAYWFGLFITAADVLIALALTSASDPKEQARRARRTWSACATARR
jgi:phosphoglycerol transferase MdoB-like AlkP superfamily enzyme